MKLFRTDLWRFVMLSAVLLAGCTQPGDQASTGPSAGAAGVATATVPTPAGDKHGSWTDVTAAAGLQFTYQNGREAGVFSIVESLGGGAGLLDFDRDGLLDVFLPGGGQFGPGEQLRGLPAALFQQIGGQRFRAVEVAAGVNAVRHYTHGCTVGDYDNDGFPDIVVTGYGGLQLFRNLGDGTWEMSQDSAGLSDDRWSSSAGWGDLNGDGVLDLYVAHYVDWSWKNNPPCRLPPKGILDVCPPREFRGLDDTVYFSCGDGTFVDSSATAKLRPEGKGLGVVLADLDFDRDLDVYVANDTVDNFLYLNDGHGILEESGTLRGVATDQRGAPNGSMGVAVLDFNADLLPDLWVANYENESFALYRNDGDASFTHVSESTGIFALGSIYVGFGTGAADLDRDGDEDLVVANGHVVYQPPSGRIKQPPLVLLNHQGRYRRQEFPADNYLGALHHGRGLALGDWDNDGDIDCVFANNNEPAALVRNDLESPNRWLGVALVGTRSTRDAIGAWAELHTTAGSQLRLVCGGGSYLSQHEPRLFWGLGAKDQPTKLVIHWPSGVVQEVVAPPADRYLTVVEP